jgi:AraC-like DNA-binding protein
MKIYGLFSRDLPWVDDVHYSHDGAVRSIRYHDQPPLITDTCSFVALTIQARTGYHKTRRTSAHQHRDHSALGRAFLDGPGESIYLDVTGECSALQLRITLAEFDRVLLEDHDMTRGFSGLGLMRGEIDIQLLFLLGKALLSDADNSELALREVVARIFLTKATRQGSTAIRGISPARLRRVREAAAASLGNITLQGMAREAGMSVYHFAREFQRETGQTPWSFVTHLRVWEAIRLIHSGTAPGEAARLTGFSHVSHMGRNFRQLLGVPASEIRDRLLP